MIGKDKIMCNAILFKSDFEMVKSISNESGLSFCNIIRSIVHEYCNRIRYFTNNLENFKETV